MSNAELIARLKASAVAEMDDLYQEAAVALAAAEIEIGRHREETVKAWEERDRYLAHNIELLVLVRKERERAEASEARVQKLLRLNCIYARCEVAK